MEEQNLSKTQEIKTQIKKKILSEGINIIRE